MMGHVIGKGGQNLKTIETKTGVTLKVYDDKLYIKAKSEKSEKLAVREIKVLAVSILGLRWLNTVSARSAVLCKSQRGFSNAKQTVKYV